MAKIVESARFLGKQLGPSTDYPPDPNSPRRFVVQAHFRGASVHLDFRFALADHAEGWTVSAAIPGHTVPIVTVRQALEFCRDQANWKLDLKTGKIFPRRVRTTIGGGQREIIRPGALFAARKASVVPLEWLKVQGRTEFPPDWPKTILKYWRVFPEHVRVELSRLGFTPLWAKAVEAGKEKWDVKEIPVGATRAFPGVFVTFDAGMFSLGARKPWFFEYFIEEAEVFSGRLNFRLVRRVEKAEPEELGHRVHEFEPDEEAELRCELLPPGVAEEEAVEPFYWVLTTPEEREPRPYVLSREAIEAEWLPPKGAAALPQALLTQVPPELAYWEKEGEEALEARAALAERVQSLKSAAPQFRYLVQTFRGPIVIRTGPSNVLYWLLLSWDRKWKLFCLDNDLRLRNETAALEEAKRELFEALWGISAPFEPEPGTLLNPTKATPSRIEPIDSGTFEVLHELLGFLKLRLSGSELSGALVLAEEEPGTGIWLISRAAEAPTVKSARLWEAPGSFELQIEDGERRFVLSLDEDPRKTTVFAAYAEKLVEAERHLLDSGNLTWLTPSFARVDFKGRTLGLWEQEPGRTWLVGPLGQGPTLRPIHKEAKRQIVYGVVLSPYGPDGQGDIISEDEIEKAAHRYLIYGRQIGLFHMGTPILAFPVESYIARVDHELEPGRPESLVRRGEWVLGVWIADPEAWRLFEAGEVTGWSIQGWGRRRPL